MVSHQGLRMYSLFFTVQKRMKTSEHKDTINMKVHYIGAQFLSKKDKMSTGAKQRTKKERDKEAKIQSGNVLKIRRTNYCQRRTSRKSALCHIFSISNNFL